MNNDKMKSFFAPAETVSAEELQRQIAVFQGDTHLAQILNLMPSQILILNSCRQVVFINSTMLKALEIDKPEPFLGKRPGDLFRCSHVSSAGCGTSRFCTYCGLVNAVLDSGKLHQAVEKDSTIAAKDFNAFSLKITAVPYDIGDGGEYTLLTIQDTSDTYRRNMLERIFFHDILNMITTISAMADLEKNYPDGDKSEMVNFVSRIADSMMEEINAQRDLLAAEDGRLHANPVTIHSEDMVYSVVYFFERFFAEQGKKIRVAEENNDVIFVSDPRLLRRVLVNMVKNAMEASSRGDTVTIWARQNGELVEFRVHNEGHIREDVQLQLFRRSFSTKGEGRGIGTYSMRLLSEKYLHGHVAFASSPDNGTTFIASYPLAPG